MSHVEYESYCNIQGWMRTKYNLSGDHLIAFAVIYGFSQDGAGWYYGGREYLADWLGCSAKKVTRVLNYLLEQKMIERVEVSGKAGKCYRYRSIIGDKTSHSTGQDGNNRGQNVPYIGDKTSHITIKENLKETTNNNIGNTRAQKPTIDELRSFIEKNNYNVDPDYFYDFYESNGWMIGKTKMKDWKATVRNWNRREKKSKHEIVTEYDDLF